MTGKDKENLTPSSEMTIHKQAGKARYNWKLKDGVWIKEAVKA